MKQVTEQKIVFLIILFFIALIPITRFYVGIVELNNKYELLEERVNVQDKMINILSNDLRGSQQENETIACLARIAGTNHVLINNLTTQDYYYCDNTTEVWSYRYFGSQTFCNDGVNYTKEFFTTAEKGLCIIDKKNWQDLDIITGKIITLGQNNE